MIFKLSNAALAQLYFEMSGNDPQYWVAVNVANYRRLTEQDLVDYYLDFVGRS